MRVAILNQFYPPDLSPTAHVAASFARHRAEVGDDVTVVTGRSGYAKGVDAGAGGDAHPNLRAVRLWNPGLGKRSTLTRLVDYLAFSFGALVRVLTLPRQDVIVTMTTPPFLAVAAVMHKVLRRSTRVVLWSMDCYPDVAETYGTIRRGGFVSRTLRALNRWLYRRFDHVVCLDGAMLERLRSQYAAAPDRPPMSVVPNWEPLALFPAPAPALAPGTPFVVLYQGNLGYGHRFDTVVDAAARLAADEASFRFVGGGVRWPALAAAVADRGLDAVTLEPYVAKDETPALLAEAGAALITLDDDALGLMSPSKLHSALAMGLPILYIGPEGSNVDEAIRRFGCGVSLRHGDVDGLVDAVRALQAGGPVAADLRGRARRAFETAYSDAAALPLMDGVLGAAASVTGRPETRRK